MFLHPRYRAKFKSIDIKLKHASGALKDVFLTDITGLFVQNRLGQTKKYTVFYMHYF